MRPLRAAFNKIQEGLFLLPSYLTFVYPISRKYNVHELKLNESNPSSSALVNEIKTKIIIKLPDSWIATFVQNLFLLFLLFTMFVSALTSLVNLYLIMLLMFMCIYLLEVIYSSGEKLW